MYSFLFLFFFSSGDSIFWSKLQRIYMLLISTKFFTDLAACIAKFIVTTGKVHSKLAVLKSPVLDTTTDIFHHEQHTNQNQTQCAWETTVKCRVSGKGWVLTLNKWHYCWYWKWWCITGYLELNPAALNNIGVSVRPGFGAIKSSVS